MVLQQLILSTPHGQETGWHVAALPSTPDQYSCPNMVDLTSRLHGCTIFSKMDLRKGYHQVPVVADSVQKTTIVPPFRLFESLPMSFGLGNVDQMFKRRMDDVMQGLDYVFSYMGDMLVASSTPEEHAQHMQEVLSQLEQRGLVLNGGKYIIGVTEVEYLGHVVSARGISPLPERVHAIQEYPRPASTQQLQYSQRG